MNSPLHREHIEIDAELKARDLIEINEAEDAFTRAAKDKTHYDHDKLVRLRTHVIVLCRRFHAEYNRRPFLRNGIWN